MRCFDTSTPELVLTTGIAIFLDEYSLIILSLRKDAFEFSDGSLGMRITRMSVDLYGVKRNGWFEMPFETARRHDLSMYYYYLFDFFTLFTYTQ